MWDNSWYTQVYRTVNWLKLSVEVSVLVSWVYLGCTIIPVLILIYTDADSQKELAVCPTVVTPMLTERISIFFTGGGKTDHS